SLSDVGTAAASGHWGRDFRPTGAGLPDPWAKSCSSEGIGGNVGGSALSDRPAAAGGTGRGQPRIPEKVFFSGLRRTHLRLSPNHADGAGKGAAEQHGSADLRYRRCSGI